MRLGRLDVDAISGAFVKVIPLPGRFVGNSLSRGSLTCQEAIISGRLHRVKPSLKLHFEK
jgi:hypothetical protein